ncbi:MAG: hypothetical protein Q4D93_05210 [Porphyromonas sp.]|nr:hypothetical protein [Porphyromonas sp.]
MSGLWIKFSIRSLGIEESYKFVEWSKSANAMISLSILYSAGLVLLKRYNTLDISFISSWLPIILVVLTYLTHEITFHIRKKQLPTPAHCPNHTPIIRISIIKDDKIWLTTHPYTGCCSSRDKVGSCIEKDKLDLPLNTCQLPGETIDDVLRRVEQDSQLELEEPPKHLISYTCDDGRVRHVFVIQSEVKEPQLRGDFFTAEQVTELYAKDKLNSYLTEEYNYLKNTLFLAHKINKSKR